MTQIPLSRPDITDKEINAVCDVLKSSSLSLGPKLGEFENAFAEYAGRKHGIAVNSGTSGLFVCIKALGIGHGDEVITTPPMLKVYSNFYYFFTQLLVNTKFGKSSNTQPFFNEL